MNRHRGFRISTVAACAALSLALASCVGVASDARIAADGSVRLELTYTVASAAGELGRLGENAAYLPLPVGRDELELAARRAGGGLASWSRSDASDRFTIRASLSFPNVVALASFFDPAGEKAVYQEAAGRRTLSLALGGDTPSAAPELVEFVRVAFGDYEIALRFELPSAVLASEGFTVSGRAASFAAKAAELFAAPAPRRLSLSW